jgi:hypothetical protein
MEFPAKVQAVTGIDELWHRTSLSHMASVMYKWATTPNAQLHVFLVDHARVDAQKAAVAALPEGESAKISTNDVLTSAFGRTVHARLLQMVVNWRGRLAGIGVRHAGNYESRLLLDEGGGYGTPQRVRAALAAAERAGSLQGAAAAGEKSTGARSCTWRAQPMPLWLSFFRHRHARMTSWVRCQRPLNLPGCTFVAHTPAGDLSVLLRYIPYDLMIVFRVQPAQLGVMVLSREFSRDHYLQHMPLKDSLALF